MPNFRRGLAGMNQSQEKANSSSGSASFVRNIIWTKDREEKFIAFLNRASDMPTVEYHSFIEVGQWKNGKPRYEEFIARTDPGVGESSDELQDRLGKKPQLRTIGVGVELEPTYSTVNGRKRPTGFAVKTETFERKTDNGVEEVTVPVVGPIVQSPRNFYGWVGSFDESTAPIEDTPVQIIRRGKDAGTQYDFTPYLDQPIDYTNLIDYIGNVSYMRDEQFDTSGEQKDVALEIGNRMLDKRLDELTDKERYDRLVGPITHLEDKWGNNNPPARPTQAAKQPDFDSMVPPVPQSNGNSKFDELRRMHEAA